jgi:glutaredoxin-related protein
MSSVLYYSNYCENSNKILELLSKTNLKNEMHFICVDKRVRKQNNIYIILNNGQEMLLPEKIVGVPALLLLNKGHKILFGNNIINYLEPEIDLEKSKNTLNKELIDEPLSFSLNSNGFGVISDEYSFLDQNNEDLSAKGNGGMRQQHHYASIRQNYNIETPPDTYKADTIGEVSMEKLLEKRNNEVNK